MDFITLIILAVISLGTVISVVSFRNIKKYAHEASYEQRVRVNEVNNKVESNRKQLSYIRNQ